MNNDHTGGIGEAVRAMGGHYIIAVDFDGTLCESNWPRIGLANDELFQELRYYQSRGHKLILWTCRSGARLDEAVAWCSERELHFDAVNENLPEMIEKFGGDTRKIFADLYIDDKAECVRAGRHGHL